MGPDPNIAISNGCDEGHEGYEGRSAREGHEGDEGQEVVVGPHEEQDSSGCEGLQANQGLDRRALRCTRRPRPSTALEVLVPARHNTIRYCTIFVLPQAWRRVAKLLLLWTSTEGQTLPD